MPMDPEEKELDLLFQKYSLLKTEALKLVDNYRSHVRNLQILLAVFLPLATLVIRELNPEDSGLVLQPTTLSWPVWWLGAILLTLFVSYLEGEINAVVYSLVLVGQRMRALELRINAMFSERQHLLVWETRVVPLFYEKLAPVRGVHNPHFYFALPLILLSLLFSFAIPLWVHLKVMSLALPWGAKLLAVVGILLALMPLLILCNKLAIVRGMRAKVRPFMEEISGTGWRPQGAEDGSEGDER